MAVETPREFGDELRRERELRDVTREQLALVTKVSVRQIEALEKGRFDILPALVFSRGFVRSIALHLGLDAERTVAAYRHVWEHWDSGRAREMPPPGPVRPTTATLRTRVPRRTVATSAAIRAVAVAATLAVVTGIAVLVKSRPPEARRGLAASASARPESGPASLALPPSVAAATVALPTGSPLPGRSTSAAPRPSGTETSTLVLSFREDCWTEVLVDGKVAARELFPKGATREFPGGRTFTLTLGNAGAVELTLDGKRLPPIGGPGDVVKNHVIESPEARTGG
jgi:cytoskeleton protein RodZ